MKNSCPYRQTTVSSQGRRGFTLTEIAIVLGIAGIILAAIWAAAASVSENNRIDQAAQEMQTVSQNLLTLYQGRPWPPTIPAGSTCPALPNITGNAISAGVIPKPLVTGACTATHAWGGNNFKISANAVGAPAGTFRVSFLNIPIDACIALLMRETNCDPTQSGCPIQILTDNGAVNAVIPNPLPVGTSVTGWQNTFNITVANNLCNLNGPEGGGNNSVEFDFKL
jgi:prepilin-type N-terminal cleavage/methylation domain-containing protein